MQPDKALIAILIKREHSRLASQVKALEKLLDKPYSEANSKRLHDMYEKWRDNLCNEKGLPRLLQLMSELIDAYENQPDSVQDAWVEVSMAAGFYRMGHWTFTKHFLGNFNQYMNDFGSIRPEYHKAFKKQYEPKKPLPVEEQSRMLKVQYDLIPHKDDPYRYKELKARGLVDENGFVAMGVQNALAMIKAEEEKPKWQRKVIDFSRYLKKKLEE
jgi:hypothetical protein